MIRFHYTSGTIFLGTNLNWTVYSNHTHCFSVLIEYVFFSLISLIEYVKTTKIFYYKVYINIDIETRKSELVNTAID